MTDPLTIVRDALERAGCAPHGPAHDFRARCPGHDGGNPESLHVCEGVDRRALVHCFAHLCDTERITSALSLSVSDLFPPGHYRAQRRPLPDANRTDFTGSGRLAANVLLAQERLGRGWRVTLVLDACPYCGSPNAGVLIGSTGKPWAHCEGSCTARQIESALANLIGGGS